MVMTKRSQEKTGDRRLRPLLALVPFAARYKGRIALAFLIITLRSRKLLIGGLVTWLKFCRK